MEGAVQEEVPVVFVVVVHLAEDAELLEGLPEEEGVPVAEVHLEVGVEGDSHRIESKMPSSLLQALTRNEIYT